MTNPKWPLRVYFDGACPLCSREIRHYQKRNQLGRIQWVDIASPGFNAATEGLDPLRIQQAMHARAANGTIFIGVEAFIEIWRALPSVPTAMLRGMLKIPGMMWLSRLAYRLFAKNRYRLTGRCTPEGCGLDP